jgi:hypothetical protein
MDSEAAAMMRTAGMLLGALLMLAFFMLVLNTGPGPVAVPPATDSEIPAGTVVVEPEPPAGLPDGQGREHVPVAEDEAADPGPAPGDVPRPDAGDTLLVLDPQAWNEAVAAGETAPGNGGETLLHYTVWTSFRSEWAADGFARRLTRATDVPVEVVNEAPGDYRVVLRYRDEGEREDMLRQIEAVTGLELEP